MPAEPTPSSAQSGDGDLQRRLEWWRAADLITDDQVHRILEQERLWAAAAARSPQRDADRQSARRTSAVVEGLGYIGGILTLVGAVLLVARYWDDMSVGARLALGVGAAVVLLVAGLLVPENEPALVRLRWSLWTLSTAAAALTIGITMTDAIDDVRGSVVVFAVAAVVALENGALWAGRHRPVQQGLFLVAVPVVTGSATASLLGDDVAFAAVGVVVACTGAALLLVALRSRVVYPALTAAVGTAAVVAGMIATVDTWHGAGYVVALLVVGALLVLALAPNTLADRDQRLVIGLVALVGLWQLVPAAIVHFATDAGLATGLVVAVIGVALLEVGRRGLVAVPLLVLLVGGAALVGGLAITGVQSVAFATCAGLVVALVLIGLGTRPGWAIMSVFGAVGLLVNVPWAISWFFPGEGRAPLLIAVAGILIIGAALLLAGMRGRLRQELDRDTTISGGPRSATVPTP